MQCITTKDLLGNPKPRVSLDQTEIGPGSGNILKNILGSGWGISFRGRSGSGIFYWDMSHFSQDFRDELEP